MSENDKEFDYDLDELLSDTKKLLKMNELEITDFDFDNIEKIEIDPIEDSNFINVGDLEDKYLKSKERLVRKDPPPLVVSEEELVVSEPIATNLAQDSSSPVDYYSYQVPGVLKLVTNGNKGIKEDNDKYAREKGQLLIKCLEDLDIEASSVTYSVGPTFTKYEIEPGERVKPKKFIKAEKDIKKLMEVSDLLLEAPIGDSKVIGITISNHKREEASLADLFRIREINRLDYLNIPIGIDMSNQPIVCDIRNMPNLLIAGMPGSGKAMCLNTIILSILLRAKPDEVKLLLIDPKRIELAPYKDVSHLMSPIKNDIPTSIDALNNILAIMERRNRVLESNAVNNIEAYHNLGYKMPYILVVINEFAEMVDRIEEHLVNIKENGARVGIHMVVATEKSTSEIISTTMRNCFDSRIAFKVASILDSRAIIDEPGAEKLLSKGDMLYKSTEGTVRVQGATVSYADIANVVVAVKKQGIPRYDEEL